MLKYLPLFFTFSLGALTLESPAFDDGGAIPSEYTCDGASLSPELIWTGIPMNTKAFALIITDTTIHKIHASNLNISANKTSIPVGGINMFPICPPPGEKHSYTFVLYALDNTITESTELEQHTLATSTLTCSYQRKQAS